VGPSGVGKTTIALYISERYNIPFVNTSASKIWPKYGFNDHEDAHRASALNPSKGLDYQLDIINDRYLALFKEEEWVCDRSPIDNFIYFMLEISPYMDQGITEQFINKCKQTMELGNVLIIIPFTKNIKLEKSHRITNPYYHQMFSILMEWVLWSKDINISKIDRTLVLNQWDFNLRKQIVDEWVKKWWP